MSSLFVPEFFFYFLYSFLSIIISIFVPGYVIVKTLHLGQSKPFLIVEGFVVGTAAWVAQGFFLGFINLRFLSYVYIASFVIVFLITSKIKNYPLKINKNEIFALLLILAGVVLQSTAAFFMGVSSKDGLSFCCVDISDNLYFASLSQAASNNIPPFEPGLHGIFVNNYHYLSNIFIGELSRIYFIPVTILQFQVSNVYLPIMLGLTVLVFGRTITKKWRFTYWLLFFIYFGGDFIWLILLFQNTSSIFSMSSLEDGAKFLSNPPRSYAVVQFFGGLSLLKLLMQKDKDIGLILTTALIFGTLIGFKVYFGLFCLIGLGAMALFGIFRRKLTFAFLFIFALVISLAFYLPVNKNAGGLYFTSFWFFENFIVQPGLHLERLELARRIFFEDQKYLKSYFFDLIFVALTIFSLFGTKLVGLLQGRTAQKILPMQMHFFFLSGILVSFILGFFFQQVSGGSNTFNFIVNIFIILSVYCATTMTWLTTHKTKVSIILSVLVILLTVPRVAYEFQSNITKILTWNVTTFPHSEMDGLQFLSQQEEGLVLVDHRHFKLDEISPYMSLYAKQPMFLSGLGILDSHGVKMEERKRQYETIIKASSPSSLRALYDSNISYIVTVPKELDELQPFIRSIYTNNGIQIVKVYKEKLAENFHK